MSDNKSLSSNSSNIKYQHKYGTILYEEDIHYDTKIDTNNIITSGKSNQDRIDEIIKKYR